MNPVRTLLLHVYYHVSRPLRWCSGRRAAARRRVPVVVLAYHRIADDRANAWTMSQRTFTRHVAWLRKHFELISLEEAQRRIVGGGNCRPAVSITFDDGYADNCGQAIPLLVKERIPCTYFVTVRNVLSGEPFAHDLAAGRSLPPNSLEQLQAMAAAGVEIAAHSYSHADLGRITDPIALDREVVTAGEELRAALGRPVRYFAFPFGQHANLNAAAFALARQAGYEAVCSAYGGFNFPGDDAFHLQRVVVGDDMIHLKNWTTVDPRKLKTPRFVYDGPLQKTENAPLCR
jgi:peptidoglycan/xylan/chitin deacetylase (PgdA/CDA1 family)